MKKRVVYVNKLMDDSYLRVMEKQSDIDISRFENATEASVVSGLLAGAHAYQVSAARDELDPQYQANAAFLARAPNLLVVSTNGSGYDIIDVDDCTRAGILVVNQAGGNAEAVAEHALGMILCLSKRIGEADVALKRGTMESRHRYVGRDIKGKTVGIVGIGHVGGRVAELCRVAFGMRVLAYDPMLSKTEVQAKGAEQVDLDTLLAASDIISVHCPRSVDTLGLIGEAAFARMRKGAIVITTARGGILNEHALAAALERGDIAGAGLDVWASEPPPKDHPLLKFDNVLATPHTAGATSEARHHTAEIAAHQVIDILAGKRPERLINPEAWPSFVGRYEAIFGRRPAGA